MWGHAIDRLHIVLGLCGYGMDGEYCLKKLREICDSLLIENVLGVGDGRSRLPCFFSPRAATRGVSIVGACPDIPPDIL